MQDYAYKKAIRMRKKFYKSMTFWGALLLGIEAVLKGYGITHPTLSPVADGLGIFLTAFGIRRALA